MVLGRRLSLSSSSTIRRKIPLLWKSTIQRRRSESTKYTKRKRKCSQNLKISKKNGKIILKTWNRQKYKKGWNAYPAPPVFWDAWSAPLIWSVKYGTLEILVFWIENWERFIRFSCLFGQLLFSWSWYTTWSRKYNWFTHGTKKESTAKHSWAPYRMSIHLRLDYLRILLPKEEQQIRKIGARENGFQLEVEIKFHSSQIHSWRRYIHQNKTW